MNFRECVIDCLAKGDVVQSFNRLHEASLTSDLLSRLQMSDDGKLQLTELDESQQELLACFILFVHRHVWRKVKLAESRVTRVCGDRTLVIDLSRLEQVGSFTDDVLHS